MLSPPTIVMLSPPQVRRWRKASGQRLLVILNAAQRSEESGLGMISTFRSVRYFLSAGQILRCAQDDRRSAGQDATFAHRSDAVLSLPKE
jgi:hypothetical protein